MPTDARYTATNPTVAQGWQLERTTAPSRLFLLENLPSPNAVKFDPDGNIVSTQVASGEVVRIDPRSGEQLAQLTPGLDHLTFVGNRLFVSNFTGEITEILGGGETRTLLPRGLNWPLDLAVDLDTEARQTIASGLPVGPPPGVEPKPLKGMPPFSGPQGSLAGITTGSDGRLYVSAVGYGTVLALRRTDR